MNFAAIMRAIAAAPGAASNQANALEDQAQATRMQGLTAPLPQNVQPAFRTPDAIGLLIGALLSSGNKGEVADFVAGFQQAKQGKAAQDTQRNQQQYQLRQARNELTATGFERKAANARKAGASLTAGMQGAAEDAESRRRFNLEFGRKVEADKEKAALANRKLNNTEWLTLSKLDPAERYRYAIDTLKKDPEEAAKYAAMTTKELLEQAQAALAAAKTTTETETLKPKIDSIVAGTGKTIESTKDIASRRKERDALAPGKLKAQMRADALKASQIEMNDARIVKINADIEAQAKRVENSWRNVTSQIESRARTGGKGKNSEVTATAQFNAYNQELTAIRKQRDGLKKKLIDYKAALQLGDPKLKGFYEVAIEDTNKMINDLGKAGVQAVRKREAVKLPVVTAVAVSGPPGVSNQPPSARGPLALPPGLGVEPIPKGSQPKPSGKGGKVPKPKIEGNTFRAKNGTVLKVRRKD